MDLPPELWIVIGHFLPWNGRLALRAVARACTFRDVEAQWWQQRCPPTGAWLAVGTAANGTLQRIGVDWYGRLLPGLCMPPVRRIVRQVASSSSYGQDTLWWVLELDGRLWQGRREQWHCPPLPAVRHISGSASHALAVDMSGRGWSLGRGKSAAVALARRGLWSRWRPMRLEVTLRTAEAGMYASVLLDVHGQVWTCGDNSWEQLGQGVKCRVMPRQRTPKRLAGLPPMRAALGASGLLALISVKDELWLGGWTSPMFSEKPVFHSSGIQSVAVSDYHLAIQYQNGEMWTGGYFAQDGKLARPATDPVRERLHPTAHGRVCTVFADTVGINRACTAWASADGTWHWAGASPSGA